MRWLVTGCARSGTVYMPEVIGATHEKVFNADRKYDDNWNQPEVSWMAMPWLPDLVAAGGTFITHITRHPLMTIASLYDYHLFASDSPHALWRDWIYKQAGVTEHGPEMVRCIRYWLFWNAMIEPFAHERKKVEDIKSDTVPTHTNTGGRKTKLDWDDLGNYKQPVLLMAQRYGYTSLGDKALDWASSLFTLRS